MRRLGDFLLRAANPRESESKGGKGRYLALLLAVGAGAVAAVPGCGDDTNENPPPPTTSTSGPGSGGAGGTGGTGGDATTGTAGGGGEGGVPYACTETATGTTRGSAIAVSPDDTIVVSVNRDVGTVTVIGVDYTDGQPALTKTAELDLGAGSEPWQVAIDACGTRAYVVLRKDQRVVAIDNLDTAPTVGATVSVGSEPTGLALTPNNTSLYVANWVDGTLSRIDTSTMTVTTTVDLNATLVGTGLIGNVAARPALAHPRALAITNDADAEDNDETIYVTEWFAQRTAPEDPDGRNSDTNKQGLVYKVPVEGAAPTAIALPPVLDTGFLDKDNNVTGCFPNQVASITIEGQHAYVTSTCASPEGPIGVFVGTGACTVATQEQVCGFGGTCNEAVMPAVCNPNTRGVKTTTHPAVTIIDLADDSSATTVLDQLFVGKASARMPLLPTDIGFFNNFAYVSSLGADAVFRLVVDNGAISDVGSATNDFIDMRIPGEMPPQIRTPIGIATGHTQAFAFVANEGTRDVTALAFNSQSIAVGTADDYRVVQASDLPADGTLEDRVLKGKRFFNTGLGRWSLAGEAWGSCAACHIDGLSDNVTWYFARGPRQSTSLDGTFASNDPTDQRILNWTAIFDEISDFELNTRGVSGGLGAIVNPANTRIDLLNQVPPQQGLQGSATDAANPAGMSSHPHSVLPDFLEIEDWVKTVRSPRKPTNLVQADVDAGRVLFTTVGQGNCIGCHSGAKWTISTLFYTPGDIPNAATADPAPTSLSNVAWNGNGVNGFPAALFPIKGAADPNTQARMRFGAPPGAEQIQCILRPVGTFAISPPEVAVVELRQDMAAQGQGNADTGFGFNPPSLLGMQVAGPFFHAGNARTLEEVFSATFVAHHQSAIAQVFNPNADQVRQLVAFVLSIDEDEQPVAIPPKGMTGGDLCFYP